MIKDELVRIALKKGFLPKDKTIYPGEGCYYLWLCELSEWLRKTYTIHTWVETYREIENGPFLNQGIVRSDLHTDKEVTEYEEDEGIRNNFNDAFESVLVEALKLIDRC